jgi:hypothetical protein
VVSRGGDDLMGFVEPCPPEVSQLLPRRQRGMLIVGRGRRTRSMRMLLQIRGHGFTRTGPFVRHWRTPIALRAIAMPGVLTLAVFDGYRIVSPADLRDAARCSTVTLT